MSLSSRLEALKETYESKNATFRMLFDQRLDSLRNNIISFIGNALQDETAKILNESDTTRAFVVDRILEIVSDNLESEKETTIFKLITSLNESTKTNELLTAENGQLKAENDIFVDTQKNIDNNCAELNQLKQNIIGKELQIKSQSDEIKSVRDELQIKMHEFDRQQTENDEQHQHIQKLHQKLDHTLKNLQTKQTDFDQHCIENKQLKSLNEKNEKELKKCNKQIECLKTSLIKSESERLILRKQYIEIGNKLEDITNNQNKQSKDFENKNKNKNNTIHALKHKNEKLMVGNELLTKKLNEQSHSLSKKMKKELGKTKILCDDVAILRKQLESERNISKMYVDELQKLKMELNTKRTEINYNEKHLKNTVSAQKKKMHKYYRQMIDSNMVQLQNEYEAHINQLRQQYDETLNKIQNHEKKEFIKQENKLLSKIKESEKKYNKNCVHKLEEYKSKCHKLQKEIETLTNDNNLKDNQIKEIETKQNEEKESFQRLLCEKQNGNQDLIETVTKLRDEKDNIQQNKFADNSKAHAIEYDLRQNIEALTYELEKREKEYVAIKSKLEQQHSNNRKTENFNWRYQEKLNLVREFCKNIRREMRNNKNEIEYMKSSVSMHFERLFHEIQISLNEIQSKSAKSVLKKEHGLKHKLTKSMKQLKKMQDFKLQSMEKKYKYELINTNKINNKAFSDNANMKELNVSSLQNEVNIIKNELLQAQNVLSPKKITFKKISMPSSITSSMLVSRAPSVHISDKSSNKLSVKKLKKGKINNNKSVHRDSFDTATIRKLRNDLQSLESNYKYSQKITRKKYSAQSDSLDSSSLALQ